MGDQEQLVKPWWLLPVRRVHPLWWAAAGVAVIWIDNLAGGREQFPVLYVIPVTLAAWYSGRRTALALAVAVPLAHIAFLVASQPQADVAVPVVVTVLRGAVILVMALWFARLAEHERQLTRYVVKLEGLLPICSICKSIRNEGGKWEPLEVFISQRSDADFTHGLCPNCVREHYSSGWERTSHR